MEEKELFKIFYYLTKDQLVKSGHYYDMPEYFILEMIKGLKNNPKYQIFFSKSKLELNYQIIKELHHLAVIMATSYLMTQDTSQELYYSNPNQEYRLIHCDKEFNLSYDWQLFTDGEVISDTLGTYPNSHTKAAPFEIPGKFETFVPDCWPIRNVMVANAKFAILCGKINNEIHESKFYTLDEDILYIEELLSQKLELKDLQKLTSRSPYVYKLSL